jgi:ADP-ribosylglycohydrolase
MDINRYMEVFMNISNMMYSRALNLFLFASSLVNSGQILSIHKMVPDYTSVFTGSMLAGGVGDALGRITEFIPSTEKIFKQYPHGVRSYNDFLARDWLSVPAQLKNKKIAPYTDDTAMAKLVMKVLIESKEHNWNLNETMWNIATSFIADAFVVDSNGLKLGWIAPFRAPGNACIAGVKQLCINLGENGQPCRMSPLPWDVLAYDAGGCGSVMHAHPFGLVFADNPEKAALWAAEHSKLTHGDPMALAACAAMATGTAYAVQGKTPDYIVGKMIAAANRYDAVTANKINSAYMLAQQAKDLRKPFGDIFQAYKNPQFRAFNDHVFSTFLGWAAHDAIAATVYAFVLSPDNVMEAIYLGVHTPGDSDSIASMAGALVGARVGVEQLPQELVVGLENSVELAADAAKAANLLKVAK